MAVALLRLAFLLAVAVSASCYSPKQLPCAFSCADDGICPAGFTCQADGVCHRDDSQAICDIPSQIDAGDAGAADGNGPDSAADDAATPDGP
jgi:hypothetical protein